ncbi:thiopeptide-type bacteriocin biosynthesis protein [Thermopolyspora sp. NPDC052614]|uniref:thiopeptide-type bacteriocin biosynthesis protein n=1 Tax=Thermopolyspora sp. NPDC052614 TaxID=3155682 RepID=UPI0034341920
MTQPVWLSAHVFRHDDLDELLLTQIAPLMRELVADGLVLGFFFLRHWEGGLHVRLRMRTDPADADKVGELVTNRLGAYLRAHPSRHPANPADYPRLAAELAALEGNPGYERRLFPPDTIRFIPYQPEHRSFGDGPSLAAVERHFCESTAVALDTLTTPPPQRVSPAMAMTLAALLCLPANADIMSYEFKPNDEAEAATKAAWLRSRDELTALAERLRTADTSTESRIPALAWLRSFRELRDRLGGLCHEGRFVTESKHPLTHALDRCLHLHLNRLGIPLPQEARLRRLALYTLRHLP